ncbi:Glycosyltransferase, catalytic subunit of cellulose synthase and poly-beta-1,6-N-acetylglucosamine synthase [Duganella sp. CF517]|uniref:glycosyltransferase family 2 protein n=1 Tax=Duganella sp. CF517 TaxID=1881038 RepID=UPI0008BCA344|nr:glycosyltransferase family 2 protein [Duganella sp. CF517]SEN47984.1 Glycosyltransferase, catalytic subunit of cellulose synthase and poly-beta-1,6-N-acetylglucosamine synthase [Duganella sp. CF517]
MSAVLAGLLYIVLALLAVPVLVLLTQALLAIAAPGPGAPPAGRRPRIAILVPAHNEQDGVGATIATLLPQLQDGDRVLVVADNCSDDTAGAARAAGAEVRERFDATLRGKGYALDFGVRCLAEDPPGVMMIVDADCLVEPGAIDRLARTAVASGRPVQALYLMRSPAGSGPMKKIAEFAWAVKNLVRPLGFLRLGIPCPLMGSGMAFPWGIISTASLANGHIVEDMKLGMDLARAGTPPLFCPQALVSSTFPASDAGTETQRKRWEHGHLSMILSAAPRFLLEGLLKGRPGMVGMALDLAVPPLALLVLMVLALGALTAVFTLFGGGAGPLLAAVALLAALGVAVLVAWWRYGRKILSAANLAMAVLYVFWKVPVYIGFLVNRQVEWVRSKRDTE